MNAIKGELVVVCFVLGGIWMWLALILAELKRHR